MSLLTERSATRNQAEWRIAYRDTALGSDVVEYLRHKTKRLTAKSYRGYERALAMLAIEYPDTPLAEFEPPDGTRLLEDFLANHWADANPKTYNIQLSVRRGVGMVERIGLFGFKVKRCPTCKGTGRV